LIVSVLIKPLQKRAQEVFGHKPKKARIQ